MKTLVGIAVVLLLAGHAFALYSEQKVEQAQNQAKLVKDVQRLKAVVEAKAFAVEQAKWTATHTPDKSKPTMTATATATPTVGKEKTVLEEEARP
jgi:inhibitor of KinA sporulation pathway (predicted exonuclease)